MLRRRLKGRPSTESSVDDYLSAYRRLPGWLRQADLLLFQKINELQRAGRVNGDVLEIGVFRGRSAILLGYLVADDESLVVCDLFRPDWKNEGLPAPPRDVFERNYLQFHPQLPTILQCSSLELAARCEPRSFRLIHVDGGHSYDVVRADVATAKTLLLDGGIVVFDDYLNRKFPGVAAAVWGAVAADDLVPICLTTGKMYAAWSPELLAALIPELETWARKQDLGCETFSIMGRDVLKVGTPRREIGSQKATRAMRALMGRSRRTREGRR